MAKHDRKKELSQKALSRQDGFRQPKLRPVDRSAEQRQLQKDLRALTSVG